MNTFQISIAVSLIITFILGIIVFVTNTKRVANKGFAVQTLCIILWLGSMLLGAISTKAENVEFWVRMTLCMALLVPLGADILRISIVEDKHPFKNNRKRIILWIISILPVFMIAWTHYFIKGVHLPTGNESVARPEYNWGFLLYIIQFNGAIFAFAKSLTNNIKKSSGIARLELKFIVFGSALALIYGSITSLIIPFFTGYSEVARFLPYAIMIMHGTAAYGIVAHRIMNVGDIIRRMTAYTLLAIYLACIYIISFYLAQLILGIKFTNPENASHVIATLIIAFSMVPANGWMQKVAKLLFADMQVIDEKDALQRTNNIVMSITTTEELIKGFVAMLLDITGASHLQVFIFDNNKTAIIYPEDYNNDEKQILPSDNILMKQLQKDQSPISIDILHRARTNPENKALIGEMEKRNASLAFGIKAKENLCGILLLGSRTSGKVYSIWEYDILQIICNEFGIALDNARLYTVIQNSKIYNDVLLDSLINGIIAVDVQGTVNVFNKRAQEIIGLKADMVINNNLSVLPPELADTLTDTLQNNNNINDKEIILYADDRETVLQVSTTTFRGHKEEHAGALMVINDISHIKNLEKVIRRTDRLSSLGTLAAGIAHEIKNPLVSINTFAQLLPERYKDDEFRTSFFELMGKEIGRIDKLLNRLLDFSRPAKPIMAFVELDRIVDECIHLVSEQMKKNNIEMVKDWKVKNNTIIADKNLLKQVFVNFLLNAIQCMESGGTITITAKHIRLSRQHSEMCGEEDGIFISFADTGSGVPEEDMEHIFDPFFTTKSTGTGLGLAVAHSILAEHDATVEVKAVQPHGASFNIVIPVKKELNRT